MMQGMSKLYDRDFYTWTIEQAAALRAAGAARTIDWYVVADEVESMGRSQVSELGSRCFRLLAHLLKWQYHSPTSAAAPGAARSSSNACGYAG